MAVQKTYGALGRSNLLGLFFVVGFSLFLSGCDLAQNHLKPDRTANLEMQDYRDALSPRLPEVDDASDDSSIPGLQPYITSDMRAVESMPLVSISVNQSVPIRDVLFELAKQADYDIELDPSIRGSIIFTARDRPFDQVVERISDIAGLRYKFEDNVLRVEVDRPYNKTYKIDYLSYIRSNKGNIRNDIAVVSGDGADTGSAFEASSESESDFWGELETGLEQILGATPTALKTSRDPRITATEQNPDVESVAVPDEDGNVQVAPPEAVLKVESLPVDDDDGGGSRRGGGRDDPNTATFSLNKQAGMINVYATQRNHKEVAAYLTLLKKSVTAQVLIEAKILEVALNDDHQTGIDWRALDLGGLKTLSFLNSGGGTTLSGLDFDTNAAPVGSASFNLGYADGNVEAFLSALSDFGTVRALASPRLTVVNNQSAILNVATNRVFFEIDIDVTNDGVTTQTDIDSDIRNVPEGVLVNVIPSINLDNNTISLALRPTITRVVNNISDPAIDFVAATAMIDIESLVPELNVQEIDSVIQVRSGQPIVMGGLLQDRLTTDEVGVPVASEIPMFGALFRQHTDGVQKTELVVFLKATILNSPSESIHNTDRDLYRTFAADRRPFKL